MTFQNFYDIIYIESEVITMIKCPHCGSTAQVKPNGFASLSRNKEYLTLGCECGCGCNFTVDYNTSDYEEAHIEYIEKR